MSELKATTAQEIVRNEKDCDYMDELFGGVKMPPTQVYLKAETDAAIAKLNAENQSLKRALWLARAKRAEARKNYWYVRSIHEGDKNLWSIDGSAVKYIGCIKRTNFDWLKIWSEVESMCRAKAEKFRG